MSTPETPSDSDPRAHAARRLTTRDFELRTERPGRALRGLAAELVDERRTVGDLRHEVTHLNARLESWQPSHEDEPARRSGALAHV